jgi:glycosyltransferase involved in cell wall biosynthesis
MLTGRDIIYISSIEWTFLWQVHQEIALRLARAGNRVLYIENTGVRSPGIKDAGRIIARLRHWATSLWSRGVREVAPGVFVCSPLVLPPFGSSLRRAINNTVLLPLIKRVARRLGMRDPLIWTYLPTDIALDLIKKLRTPRSLIVYYCVADFAQLSTHPSQIAESEQALVQNCDVVFAMCEELATHCAGPSHDIKIFPPGVDLDAFPLASTDHTARDADIDQIARLPRPLIGYVGGLHRYVDIDLIVSMARARPEWSWVFIGPFQISVEQLLKEPNIHLLGPKPHNQLVDFIRAFDVCIVPYVKSIYTNTVVPVKINEYLAVGKPVVATNLPTICEFNERHKVLITAENQADPFLRGIEGALQWPTDDASAAGRRQVAALCDWNLQLIGISDLIEQRLRQKKSAAA